MAVQGAGQLSGLTYFSKVIQEKGTYALDAAKVAALAVKNFSYRAIGSVKQIVLRHPLICSALVLTIIAIAGLIFYVVQRASSNKELAAVKENIVELKLAVKSSKDNFDKVLPLIERGRDVLDFVQLDQESHSGFPTKVVQD
jgi:hypothetical protein